MASPAQSDTKPSDATVLESNEGEQTTDSAELRLQKASKSRKFFHSLAPKKSQNRLFKKAYQCFYTIWDSFYRWARAVFSIPLVRDPITLCRPGDFDSAGNPKKENEKDEKTIDMIEAACNYTPESRVLFDNMLAERKANKSNKKTLSDGFDFSQYPPWNESVRDRLESSFQVFDTSGDGLVDLEEMNTILTEFGDTSSADERRRIFETADVLQKGALNFNEFAVMIHNVTVKSADTVPSTLVETFRQIDRNMARIRNYDVVQQLQAGLF